MSNTTKKFELCEKLTEKLKSYIFETIIESDLDEIEKFEVSNKALGIILGHLIGSLVLTGDSTKKMIPLLIDNFNIIVKRYIDQFISENMEAIKY